MTKNPINGECFLLFVPVSLLLCSWRGLSDELNRIIVLVPSGIFDDLRLS